MSRKNPPQHAPLWGFEVIGGCLHIGGMALPALAERIGSTPFYAYDRGLISRRIAELRSHLPDEVRLHYAIKANPMPAVVQHIAGLVDGLDLASAGEMKLALDTPMSPAHISFAGPGKRDSELRRAIAAGVLINLESPLEMERAAEAGRALGTRPRVAVRVNPDFELKTSGMKMSGGPKPFGVDAEEVPAMLTRMAELALDFEGFHIFSGSQNLREEALAEAQEKTVELAIALAAHAPGPVKKLNIGGGFGIPYFPGEQPLDLARVGAGLAALMPRIAAGLPQAAVVVELGRYIVGEAGIYVTRVVDRKISRGRVFLVTDGGMHHHLAASGNFGQVIRKNYPLAIATRMGVAPEEEVDVVGCLCTPLDRLGDKVALPRGEVGDLVVVFQSGAYGPSASPQGFLGHPAPAEVLV